MEGCRAMATETVENYLKAIYTLCRESERGEAGMSRVAAMVGVTTGTATTMVKRLAGAKLARYERFGGVTLTSEGNRAALNVLRRHRIVETFLVETLKLDWSEVHAEAERLEHAISPRVLDALDEHLGHPSVDPHGDPIPDAEGRLPDVRQTALSACKAGERVRVLRVRNQDAKFLNFAGKHGLRPGAFVTVMEVEEGAQAMTVRAQGHEKITLGLAAAAELMVASRR